MAVKPEYRLSTVLKMRERKKEAAEQFLAECLKALRVEQDRLRDMENELERMIAKRNTKMREYSEKAMRGEMVAQAVTSSNVYIERLKELEESQKDAIEGQKSVIVQNAEAVRGARKDLVDATQDLKALEKHKEKWEDEVKREMQVKQDEAMDEIAQTIFLKNH